MRANNQNSVSRAVFLSTIVTVAFAACSKGQVTDTDSLIKSLPKLIDCQWVSAELNPSGNDFSALFDNGALLDRFCLPNKIIKSDLGVNDAQELPYGVLYRKSVYQTATAAYLSDPRFEGLPYSTDAEDSVYPGVRIRLDTLTNKQKQSLERLLGMENDQLGELEANLDKSVNTESWRLKSDRELLFTSQAYDSYDDEWTSYRVLVVKPANQPDYSSKRVSKYGKAAEAWRVQKAEEDARLIEEAKKRRLERERKAAEERLEREAAEAERKAYRVRLLEGYPKAKFVNLHTMTNSQREDAFNYPYRNDFKGVLLAPKVSQRYRVQFYNYLKESLLNDKYTPSEYADVLLGDDADSRRKLLGYLVFRNDETVDRILKYHKGTIFEKSSAEMSLREEIEKIIQSNRDWIKENDWMSTLSGELTLEYDFDKRAFYVPNDKAIKFNVSRFQAVRSKVVEQDFEFFYRGALQSYKHYLNDLKIPVPENEAQAFVEQYMTETNNDNQFKIDFWMVFNEGEFTTGRNPGYAGTELEKGLRNASIDGHSVWTGQCVMLSKLHRGRGPVPYKAGNVKIMQLRDDANTEPCEYLLEYTKEFLK